jgi:putative oxidoreductase
MNLSKMRVVIGWVLAVLLTLGFLAAATGKLTGAATQTFARWGYPAWFAGGIGLLIPRTTRYAVAGLTVIMFGAIYTHLANHEGLQVLRPVIFLALLWTVWWLRGKPQNRDRMRETT